MKIHRTQHYALFFLLSTLLTNNSLAFTKPQHAQPQLSLNSFFYPLTSPLHPMISSSASYTFSGNLADSIDYIELYLATDNTCKTTCQSSNCNPRTYSTTISTGTDIAYAKTIDGGTHYGVRDTSVAAFLHAANLPSTTGGNHYFVGMYLKAKTARSCSSAYCSAGYDDAGHNLCLQATFDSTGSGSVGDLQRTDDGNVLINYPTQYMYIPNSATNSNNIQRCLLNYDGNISNCLTTPTATTFPSPSAVAFTNITTPNTGTHQHAYLISEGTPYKCDIVTGGTGSLTNCVAQNPNYQPAATDLTAIAFLTVINETQYAYLIDHDPPNNSHIYRCTLYGDTPTVTPGTLYPS